MKYSPQATPKCCDDCIHIKSCNGCYDGIEYEFRNQQKIFDYIQEKVERGRTKSVWDILKEIQ